jgi:hypothetical protein
VPKGVFALVAALALAHAAAAATPLRVLYIGDSLSYGPPAFPRLVTAGLDRRGYAVHESLDAKPGVTASYWPDSAIPRNVNVAVVELGTNDAPFTALSQFDAAYKHLIATIQAKSPHATFVCVGVWRPKTPAVDAGVLTGYANAAAFDADIKGRCPGSYVDVERFAHPPNLSGDQFHPGWRGHALIAAAVLRALRR